MKKLGVVAIAIMVAACTTEPEGVTTTRMAATTAQLRAFDALQAATSQRWTWVQHETFKTPMHLSAPRTGKPLLVGGTNAEHATLAFVGQYQALFRMRDAQSELRLAKSEQDALAMTHVRFQQVHHGIPVVGAELSAHYDKSGRLTSIDANTVADLDLEVEPELTARAAAALAKSDVVAGTKVADPDALHVGEGKLVVHALGATPVLAWQYTIRAVFGPTPAIWVTTVNASTGAIVERYNNLQTVEGTGTGVLGDAKTIQVTQSGSGYTMSDASRGAPISTYDARGQEVGPDQGARAVTSTSLTRWDTNSNASGAAVDAHFYAGVVYDYYKKVHARNGIDGAGGEMLSTAHFGQQYDNAFWDGTGMSYGDGGQLFKPLSAAVDVCGHEFTHGVTQYSSNLAYTAQSGALNESVSDIFGVFIEHSVTPDDTNNWLMGETITLDGVPLRDFKNPANGQQPGAMSQYVNTQQDDGGVHTNSGIPNNAAYLMTAGGTNPVTSTVVKFGIGWAKSEQVWYRANTKYFMTSTNFAGAAQGTMSAAKDLGLTDNEQNIIDCAWKAVGVVQGECAALTDPSVQVVPPASTGDVPTPAATSDNSDESSGTPTPTPTPATTSSGNTQKSSGCSVATAGAHRHDLGGLAALVGIVIGLAVTRRRTRHQNAGGQPGAQHRSPKAKPAG